MNINMRIKFLSEGLREVNLDIFNNKERTTFTYKNRQSDWFRYTGFI